MRRVLPLAESLAAGDSFGHAETLVSVAPALYEADATMAGRVLEQLDVRRGTRRTAKYAISS
jgi:hypothetical protein